MTRDFGAEIDSLKEELRQIKLWLVKSHMPPMETVQAGDGQVIFAEDEKNQFNDLLTHLVAAVDAGQMRGAVAYMGTFCSGDGESTRQSIWHATVPGEDLLELNDNHLLEKVLASVGNSQRLTILLALLKKPQTVNQLIEAVGANTSGQIYHHLKPLQAANIVHEEKGVYAVIPYRVQGIIMLLCGVRDLVDTRYSSGSWEG